jgi:hypothetical protein
LAAGWAVGGRVSAAHAAADCTESTTDITPSLRPTKAMVFWGAMLEQKYHTVCLFAFEAPSFAIIFKQLNRLFFSSLTFWTSQWEVSSRMKFGKKFWTDLERNMAI